MKQDSQRGVDLFIYIFDFLILFYFTFFLVQAVSFDENQRQEKKEICALFFFFFSLFLINSSKLTTKWFQILALIHNAGYNSGSLNGGNMHGGIAAGVRGPFTPSQWMELEHQALIYKYITANVSIPSNLLIPIRKAIESAGFSHFAGGLLRSNSCKL